MATVLIFPPPWEVHGANESFCIRDANGQALAYFSNSGCLAMFTAIRRGRA